MQSLDINSKTKMSNVTNANDYRMNKVNTKLDYNEQLLKKNQEEV
jgi:hypothetical protein